MRVATWNLWWEFGPWEARQPAIDATVRSVAADVWCLQEVVHRTGHSQAERLANLAEAEWAVATGPDGEAREFTNAVLSRYPIVGVESLALPHPPGERAVRSALLVVLDAPWGRQLVVSTHLAWQYDRSELREEQLAAIVDGIAGTLADDPEAAAWPPILGGDLNAVPTSPEVQRLTGIGRPYRPGLVFTDAWATVGEGEGLTWDRANPHRVDAQWPQRRVDYVLVGWPRPKPFGNPLRAELVGVEPVDGVVPSDHYGVVVDLDPRRTP